MSLPPLTHVPHLTWFLDLSLFWTYSPTWSVKISLLMWCRKEMYHPKRVVSGVNKVMKVKHLSQGLAQPESFMNPLKLSAFMELYLCSIIFSSEKNVLRETLTTQKAEGPKSEKSSYSQNFHQQFASLFVPLSSFTPLWWRHNTFVSQGSTSSNFWSILANFFALAGEHQKIHDCF